MTDDAGGRSALSSGLGPLPEPYKKVRIVEDADYPVDLHLYAPAQMRAYATAAVAAELERCIAACTEVMNAYGGDPAGRLLSSERVRMQHQLQASGAAQCIDRIRGSNVKLSSGPVPQQPERDGA